MPLTDSKLRVLKPTDEVQVIPDGFGLHFSITPANKRSWKVRYSIDGKRSWITIGQYPAMGLQEARQERDRINKLVAEGVNPGQKKRLDKATRITIRGNTFRVIADEWLEVQKKRWKSEWTYTQAKSNLENNAYPLIGNLPINEIASAHILAILQKMEARGAETYAINLRQLISTIFQYAVVTLRAESDPAAILKGVVKRPDINHSRPMEPAEIGEYLVKLRAYGGNRTTVIACHLILHTFLRTKELRGGEWSEIDLDKALWTVPAERMKMRRTHLVPLSRQCVALLTELKGITGAGTFLFPNMRNPKTCMSSTTVNRALEYMGYATGEWTGHDFRATASTRLNEAGYNPDVIERQMAHVHANAVRRAYNHAQWLEERAKMMQEWSDWVEGC